MSPHMMDFNFKPIPHKAKLKYSAKGKKYYTWEEYHNGQKFIYSRLACVDDKLSYNK